MIIEAVVPAAYVGNGPGWAGSMNGTPARMTDGAVGRARPRYPWRAASEIGMNLAEVGEHFSLHLFDGGSGRSVHDGRERLVREWEFRRHRCDVVV